MSEATGVAVRRCTFWRVILERLVLSLADQQLITGISLLLSGLITEYHALQGRQMKLIMKLSFLSSSSHLACVITLREYFKGHMKVAYIRMSAIFFYANLLFVSAVLTDFSNWTFILIFNLSLPIYVLLSFDSLRADIRLWLKRCLSEESWDKLQKQTGTIRNPPRIVVIYYAFPSMVFGTQILYFIDLAYVTLDQRLSYGQIKNCKTLDNQVDQWGFGQTLPMFLLLLPLLSATETYYGTSLLSIGVSSTDKHQRKRTHER